jgi:hypothetical protein
VATIVQESDLAGATTITSIMSVTVGLSIYAHGISAWWVPIATPTGTSRKRPTTTRCPRARTFPTWQCQGDSGTPGLRARTTDPASPTDLVHLSGPSLLWRPSKIEHIEGSDRY